MFNPKDKRLKKAMNDFKKSTQGPRLARTLPPVDIFDVLHDYEVRGGVVPDTVDKWWEVETGFAWQEQEAQQRAEVGAQPTTPPAVPPSAAAGVA